MRVRLADQSLPNGLMLHIFARTKDTFPLGHRLEGSILRIVNLESTVFRGEPRAQARLSRDADIVAFDGVPGAPLLPTPRRLLLLSKDERELIERLRLASGHPAQPQPQPQPPVVIDPPPVLVSRLAQLPEAGGGHVDLVVQVLKAGGTSVLVWDGTVHPKLPTVERYSPPYSMLALAAAEEPLVSALARLERGQWISVRNIELRLQDDRWLGGFLSAGGLHGGRIDVLDEDEPRVRALRAERAALRVLVGQGSSREDRPRSLTRTGRLCLPPSSLAQALKADASTVFRCPGLRVVAWGPQDLRDIAVPYCTACQRAGYGALVRGRA